ncbi:MAG: ADP-glyceromanno-heptose 6-epimerase [Candidatus Cloacimonadota bacterium]|nr:MAG: ADP-glyceromanno-heptose 6-epimerase [Candidatus Cloacimonadota bacterium]
MIVVTGGGGFIGSALIWGLNEKGFNKILAVDLLKKADTYKNLLSPQFSDYLEKDAFIEKIKKGVFNYTIDGIIHMGACSDTTEKDNDYLIRNNYEYTQRLAMWALKNNKRFVYASSGATYGDGKNGFSDENDKLEQLRPLNLYGKSKHLFDLWALRNEYLKSIAGLKYFNVFGPNEYHKGEMRSMVHKAFEQIKDTGKVKLFKSNSPDYKDGEQVRDFVYVKDVVRMTLFIYDNPDVNGIINIGTGIARSFNDLSSAVFHSMKKKENIDYIEMPDYLKSQYQNFTQADISKLKNFGYKKKISSLEEGVSDYVRNYLLTPDPYL